MRVLQVTAAWNVVYLTSCLDVPAMTAAYSGNCGRNNVDAISRSRFDERRRGSAARITIYNRV